MSKMKQSNLFIKKKKMKTNESNSKSDIENGVYFILYPFAYILESLSLVLLYNF